jgi:MFS family permease
VNAGVLHNTHLAEPAALRSVQLAWLAAAVFVVSAGYGALMPVLPGWLGSFMPGASAPELARHVGFFSGVYAAGVLVGAPLWGAISDRVGRSRILIIGLIGYIASQLLLLVPGLESLWGLYALRAATGLFVAAVVPVVSALVAEHTPQDKRARRFAWLSAMSLLGFLFGPGLNEVATAAGSWAGAGVVTAATSARAVIVLSALLGAVMMLGLTRTLPKSRTPDAAGPKDATTPAEDRTVALCWLSGTVMLVLAGFELGIVLQGQQHADMSPRQVAVMFAECSLVMLVVNALLFLSGMLEKIASRTLVAAGLLLAMSGLAVMAWHSAEGWLYLAIALTSAGTGLVLPVIAYLAAGVSCPRLGATMGALAATAGLGQTLGSSLGGWLFGSFSQRSFGMLIVPLAGMLVLLFARPGWWSVTPGTSTSHLNRTDVSP